MTARLIVNGEFIGRLEGRIGAKSPTPVLQEALALLLWAIEQKEKGRVIMSIGRDGSNPRAIQTPGLSRVEKI